MSRDLDCNRDQRDEGINAHDWTQTPTDVLCQLNRVLSSTIGEWHTFNRHDGAMGYFADYLLYPNTPQGAQFSRLLDNIKDNFHTLEGLEQRLKLLEQNLERQHKNVSLFHYNCDSTRKIYLYFLAKPSFDS